MEVGGWHHTQAILHPVKNPGTHGIWYWAGPTSGLDVLEKRKYLPIRGFSQPSRYTDSAVQAPKISVNSSWKYASLVQVFMYNMAAARGFTFWFDGDCYRTVGVGDAKFGVEIVHELLCTLCVKRCNSDIERDGVETFMLFPKNL